MDNLAMLAEPPQSPGGSNRVEVGWTCHHVAEGDQDATQARPEGQEVHPYYHRVGLVLLFC